VLNRAELAGSDGDLPASVRRRLVAVTVGLAALTVLHDVDHVRQGRGLPVELSFVAVFALVDDGGLTLALVATTSTTMWVHQTIHASKGS
jgi:hypothetical protein